MFINDYKKLIKILIVVFMLFSCNQTTNNQINNEEIKKELPKKEKADSPLMSESPLNPLNIDDYLFIEDVLYIDTRSPKQFINEGHIAGFTNIPFYESIAHYIDSDQVLFKMVKVKDDQGNTTVLLGDVGSYVPLYEESEELLNATFPKDKQIVFIATAGVESAYLINLLIQYGYDASLLYNCGSFTNSLANNVAYLDYLKAKYLVKPIAVYDVNVDYNWGELTPIEKGAK